jgi:hypothetical protein
MAEESFGVCSVEQMKEIIAAVKWLRQSGFMLQAGQKKPLIQNVPGLYVAVVTTAITARSGTTPGTGKATLRYMPGAATTISNYPSTADEVNVDNITTQSFAVGDYISVFQETASFRYVVTTPPPQIYFGKSSSLILANATGTVTIWNMSGTPAATSKTVTALNIGSDQDSTSNYLGVCREDESGQWIVFFEVC